MLFSRLFPRHVVAFSPRLTGSIVRALSTLPLTSTCCQAPAKKPPRSLASQRPDLDFDYLLDEGNIAEIERNIGQRKGVGDIQRVHELWKEVQEFGARKEKGSVQEYEKLWDEFYTAALLIPNVTEPGVPIGDEKQGRIIHEVNRYRSQTSTAAKKPKIAEDVLKSWRSVFYPRRVSGSKSYTLLGASATLQSALMSFAMDVAVNEAGFEPVDVPDVLPKIVTQACGLQTNRSDAHPIQYTLTDFPHFCLSGTAEMGIASLFEDKVFEIGSLPKLIVAQSRCYRPEVSKGGAEAKLYRVHEFSKVEMFAICTPEQSQETFKKITDIQRSVWDRLGVDYKVIDMASEELGAPAARKYDIEAFMPGRQLFGEVSSASNCTDYQARRLNLMYRDSEGTLRHVHTLNGTVVASTRALIALFETHQRGSKFEAPEVLKKYLPTQQRRQILKLSALN